MTPPAEHDTNAADARAERTATILVVDDNATNRALLSRVLQKGRHRVLEAANGAEAIGLARVGRPDLVITDVLMPKVDGYELERQLRSDPATADIPVIFHTAAYSRGEVEELAGGSERISVLPKPADVTAILEMVSGMLERCSAGGPASGPETGEREHLALLNEKLLQKVRELELADRERQRLLAHLVQIQEQERERIAGDIHDDSIQAMTAVSMRLEMLGRWLESPEALERHGQLQETVRRAIGRLRHLLFELHPAALEREGLAAAIQMYLEHSMTEAVDDYRIRDELVQQPPPELRASLYRIVQESLANVAKHAEASTVEVELWNQDGGVQLRIVDDGCGFAVEEQQAPRHGHLGLRSMRQRAELVGGWCRVESVPNEGTTVEVWVPDRAWTEAPA